MKLLLHGTRNNMRSNSEKGFVCHIHIHYYFKWILWLSISFYFFSSFLVTRNNNPTTSNALINPQAKKVSRSLIQESSRPYSHELKVFVYELPSKYNTDWLSNDHCSNHLFASEVAIHQSLTTSGFRTMDPSEADFFFVPVYVSCNFSKVNGFPAIGHARSLMAEAIGHVSSQLPFWNRSRGADHVFVASHDFGSCFHTLEDVAIADGVPSFLKNSIILQTFGVKYKHPCQEVKNVVIPPYISPESIRATLEKSPAESRRDIFAFFRGKMEIHPKNVSGRFYSRRVRTEIWRKYGNDRRFYLRRDRFSGYQSEMVRSKFCLCPLGWAPWSPRLVESVALGCVPVIIADGIRLPFPDVVPWGDISLTVGEGDVDRLGDILEHVAGTNLTSIQRNLWDPAVKSSLLFNVPVSEGDATWHVLDALSRRSWTSPTII